MGLPPEDPIWINVKEVLPSDKEADAEVARLNRLNKDKEVLYFSALARYYPEGRAVNREEGPNRAAQPAVYPMISPMLGT